MIHLNLRLLSFAAAACAVALTALPSSAWALCGDAIPDLGEACDDGALNSDVDPDACRTDCSFARCGDGVADTGEACDAAGLDTSFCDSDCSLPTCGDGTYNSAAGEACDDGLLNSDSAPDACRLACVLPGCGDGVTDLGETCDDAGESATCNLNCTAPSCGDGVLNVTAGETCDDGPGNSDVRRDACRLDCRPATCGDRVLDTGEACDEGPDGSAFCDADCTPPACGDGALNTAAGETCDLGIANSDTAVDGCRTTCRAAACGDGVVDTGEACDTAGDSATCDRDCTAPACGDGLDNVAAGEACDQGAANGDAPDACRATCQLPACGDSIVDSGEACDAGGDTATCDQDCTAVACADGYLNPIAETCEDLDTFSGDGCSAACQTERCGDGVVNNNATEVCDDGNTDNTDACLDNCEPALCGDGFTHAGVEACDDRDVDAGDGCDQCEILEGWACSFDAVLELSVCERLPFCGDGQVTDGEDCEDGAPEDGDGCSANCTFEDGWTCDLDDAGLVVACEPVCSDGLVRGDEGCDDTNTTPGDGCLDCLVEEDWLCTGEPSACSPDWVCGDGEMNAGEVCDDGNTAAGDGCAPDCTLETGFVCTSGPVGADEPSICVLDHDSDGVVTNVDNCPVVANTDQSDIDQDGAGDLCDDDMDDDGIPNSEDEAPGDPYAVLGGGGPACTATPASGPGALFPVVAAFGALLLGRRRRR